MITPETRVQIRRYFYAEHWKIGTIAQALNVHPDTVRRAIEVERFQHAEPLRPSIVDPYLPFVRETLSQHPRLRATRLYQMIRDRGYSGSGFAAARHARRCSGFVRTAIGGSAIAAQLAARKPGGSNTVSPTTATSGVWKAGSIIGTDSVRTGSGTVGLA